MDWFGFDDGKDYALKCHKAVSDNNLTDVIEFHPPVHDVVAIYREADLFCLPSVFEGYPNVVCEAMSCGLPVVCGRISDNPIIVNDGLNGFLFNPRDVSSITKAIVCFLNLSETEQRQMGHQSRILSKDLFSKDRFVEQYIDIL